ncbi:MAG TPA: hypothetical protein IAC12_01685 [Candidatus Aphodovivens avistercoris]|nr:hypothetical protein [Candidatus Aphodovivens avistercoris]
MAEGEGVRKAMGDATTEETEKRPDSIAAEDGGEAVEPASASDAAQRADEESAEAGAAGEEEALSAEAGAEAAGDGAAAGVAGDPFDPDSEPEDADPEDSEADSIPLDGPAFIPASHRRRSGAQAPRHASYFEPPVDGGGVAGLGVSIRTLALLAAVAAAVAVAASLVVSCGMQSMLQEGIAEQQRSFEAELMEEFEEQKAEIERMMGDLDDATAEASAAEEASSAVEAARGELQSALDEARQWLESGDGQWVSQQTKAMMESAVSVAEGLVEESGITDSQTYRTAASAIQDIIYQVEQGTLW